MSAPPFTNAPWGEPPTSVVRPPEPPTALVRPPEARPPLPPPAVSVPPSHRVPPGRGAPPTSPAPSVGGNVYRRSEDRPQLTTALPSNAMENSGSLTGHVLSRGNVDRPTPKSRVFVIVVVMLLVISVLGLAGLIAATTAGEMVRSFFDSVLSG